MQNGEPQRRSQVERTAATIARLLEATIAAIVELGYSRATVREICDRAGVSQGGLFRHFPTRKDLLVATLAELHDRQLAAMHEVAAEADPHAAIGRMRDVINAPDTTVSASFTQYVIDGSLLYHFGTGRLTPFISGGAGYLRQLIQDNSIVETGNEIHGGGGVKYWLGAGRRFGVRAEMRLSSLSGGVSLDGTKRRSVPTFSGGVAYLF